MSIAKNTTLNFIGSAVPVLVSLVSVPLYLSFIGTERFGLLSIAWLLLGYFGFVDLGLGRAIAQKIASLKDSSDELRAQVFWSALWVNLVLGLLGFVVLFFVGALAFRAISGVSSDLELEINNAVPWLAATLPIATTFSVLRGALHGRERFLAVNVIGSLSTILGSLAPLATAYFLSPKLQFLICAALAARLLAVVLMFLSCRSAVPAKKLSSINFDQIRSLLTFGGWVSVSSFLGPILAAFDRYFIGVIIGATAVTQYVVPFNLVMRVSILPQSLSNALLPRFSLPSLSDNERHNLKSKSALMLVLSVTPVVMLGITFVEPFMKIWVGTELASVSAPVAAILLAGIWLNSLAHIPFVSLQAKGRPDLIAKIHLAEAVPYLFALTMSISLVGIKGAAITWACRAAIDTVALYVLDRSLALICRVSVLPALLVCSICLATLLTPAGSVARFATQGTLDLFGVFWFTTLLFKERKFILSRILKR